MQNSNCYPPINYQNHRANIWITGTDTQLLNSCHRQGDTIPISVRMLAAGLVTDPLPEITFIAASGIDILTSSILIPATPFTVTYIPTQGVFEAELVLLPEDTEELNLNVWINRIPGRILYYDIQLVQATPRIVRTVQGQFQLISDINKLNAPSAAPAPSPTPTP